MIGSVPPDACVDACEVGVRALVSRASSPAATVPAVVPTLRDAALPASEMVANNCVPVWLARWIAYACAVDAAPAASNAVEGCVAAVPSPPMSVVDNTTAPVRPATDVTGTVMAPTAVATNAVVAICVVLVPLAAVGAVGVPVNAGDAKGALAARSVVRLVT